MNVRLLLLPLLGITLAWAFGQNGLYGPSTTHLRAGDVAPDFTFTKVLNAPGSAPWSASNLSERLTVLVFYPDTSHNPESVNLWNALVGQFAAKPVQFVWISGEEESALLPWLHEHPVKGWVFYDPRGETERAYGLELPVCVIIGANRRIVGFHTMLPTADLLNAALEGRITTGPQSKATIKAFMESNLVLLDAEPLRILDDHKPDFPPSYALHVSPSPSEGHGNFKGPTFWSLEGYGLKEAIRELYSVNPIRVRLPASLDNGKRYDFALVLPEAESEEKMKDRMRHGIEDYFHITGQRENRLLDVYVVTAPDRKPPLAKARTSDEMLVSNSKMSDVGYETTSGLDEELERSEPLSIAAIRSVGMEGTADELCDLLEGELDRPMVNETNLHGEFEFDVKSTEGVENDFLDRLRDQSGLAITPAHRNVEILVFLPR
jgi:uncharacterized protein (TIGR03435 family)